jgi:hypothetical protein
VILLLPGLHALGNHLEAQLVGHGDDGLGEGPVAPVGGQVLDEALVDLDDVDVELLQVGQGRIAGAEIVDGDLDAGGAEVAQALGHLGPLVEQQAFGDLDDQAHRR